MRYELHAVSYRDRLMIALRYIGAVAILGFFVTVVLFLLNPVITERWLWAFLVLICFSVAIEAYRARGPVHSGFVEVTDTTLSQRVNDQLEIIDLSTVTGAICFNILGNRNIILKTRSGEKEIVYSAYSNELIHDFRRVLGPRLKEGLFEVMKSWKNGNNRV